MTTLTALLVGDIVGRAGRDGLHKYLPGLVQTHKPDLIIVNGENASHGVGITSQIANDMFDLGVHVITTGNHVWRQGEIVSYIEKQPKLLRPINFVPGTPGQGACKLTLDNGTKVLVVNAMGRLYMEPIDDPFQVMDALLKTNRLGKDVDIIIVDFHAEATSEKGAFAYYCDGRVSAVCGTHTHVPTADAQILPKGTGFITDVGMTGCYEDAVLGVKASGSVARFTQNHPGERFTPAEGEATVCGVAMTFDKKTGLCQKMEQFKVGGALSDG